MLSPIAWRTPPRHYGPWEQVVSSLTEGLIQKGVDVTLFATADSVTEGKLESVCPRPWEEDRTLAPKVWEGLHIAHLMEQADRYDLIHNHFDFLPLTYSGLIRTPMLTTIHGFSSPDILPAYRKYNGRTFYVSISHADRHPDLDYLATVYHGIDLQEFTFSNRPGNYLLFFGRIHHEKGTHEAIQAAKRFGMDLVIAGIIQDQQYFDAMVAPELDGLRIKYVGPVGQPEKSRLLSGAFALLHLINFEEPFGLSLIEAMACGTPVVAFGRGSIREIVIDEKTGFIVGNLDSAVDTLKRVGQIDRKDCRTVVEERFTREQMVEGYFRVYQRIYEKTKGKAVK